MVDVAFVCLGNICRSPMAEAIMRQRLKDRNIHDIKVHSRGTGSWNLGEPPHEGTQKFSTNTIFHLMAWLVNYSKRQMILITLWLWISNVDNIKSINPNLKGQLFKLLEFSNMEESDVPDPYYTNNFEGVYDMVLSSCDNLIDYIVKDANLKEG